MAYKNEIEKIVNLKSFDTLWGNKITLTDGVTVVEGHRGILTYDDKSVRIRLKKGELELTGEGLTIAAYTEGQLVVAGKVTEAKRS